MVRTKNSCGSCCCNKCERKLPEGLRCCCNCICDTICVAISIPADSDCDCDAVSTEFVYDCVTDSWHGTIECEGLSIDLEFIVKQCDDKCYVCLVSDCLGMPLGTCPTDCQEFTPGRSFCRGTYDVDDVRIGGFSATWNGLDFSGCGDSYCGTGSITIVCAERVFPSCRGDCAEPLCIDCDCLCRCVCITYFDNDCTETIRACWDASINGWTASAACLSGAVAITITVVPNAYTDVCELHIETNIGEADNAALSCPDVTASWTIEKDDYTEATISIACDNCGDCATGVSSECCGGTVPNVLTATLTLDCDDGCADGAETDLVYNPATMMWEGTATLGTCGTELKIRMACCGLEITDFGMIDDNCGIVPLPVDDQALCASPGGSAAGTCSPFSITFNYGPLAYVECCDSVGDLTIVVTE